MVKAIEKFEFTHCKPFLKPDVFLGFVPDFTLPDLRCNLKKRGQPSQALEQTFVLEGDSSRS
jgi:hypothetical protein